MSGERTNAQNDARMAGLSAELDAQFRRPLMSFFQRRVRDAAEAEDLTQEVFLRLARRQDDAGISNISTYVFQIAANLLRDRARRGATHCRSEHFSLDAEAVAEFDASLVESLEPERVLLGEEALGEVLRALDELGERTRDIFLLHRVEKMKHAEIAQLCGLSASMVAKHVMRATSHLAKRFGKP